MAFPADLTIRVATVDDTPTILTFIKDLAEYEKLSQMVVADEAGLRTTLFGARPAAEVLIAELAGAPVGFALFFQSYSTFLGEPGSTWRTCSSTRRARQGRRSGADVGARARRGRAQLRQVRAGRCSTGTSRPSRSTRRSLPSRTRSGLSSASPARRSSRSPSTGRSQSRRVAARDTAPPAVDRRRAARDTRRSTNGQPLATPHHRRSIGAQPLATPQRPRQSAGSRSAGGSAYVTVACATGSCRRSACRRARR